MNKKIWFIIILTSLGIQQTIRSFSSFSGAEQLGKKFLKSQNLKDQSQFRSIMNQAVSQFRGNKEAFYQFLNVRDGNGCTSLLRAAALVDMDEIIFILQKLEEYYSTSPGGYEKNILDVFNFINAQCLQGDI
jgi:hypothetical protein